MREVRIPELLNTNVTMLTDYPPKIHIHIKQKTSDEDSEPPQLLLEGIDVSGCSFPLVTPGNIHFLAPML